MSEKIPKGWKWVKLGDAPLKIIDGDRGKNYPSNNELKNNGYCLFLSTKNVKSGGFCFDECQFITKEKDQALKKGKLKRFDLVFTTRGTIGNVGYFNSKVKYENIRINSGMVIIRPDTRSLNPEFNYYIFRFIGKYINSFVSGSAQPQLPIRDLKEVKLPLPPLPEQKAIAEVLSSLDDKIELLHRQNKTLEEMAMTLFRQWFIEPTKDGLPEGWEEVSLGEFFPVITGKKDANFATDDGSYPFFTCSQKPLKAPSYSFDGNAILLAGNGDFNIKRCKGKFEAYQRTYVLIPYNPEYFNFLYLLMKFNLDEITGSFKGSVINYITKDMITGFKFSLPKNRSSIKEKLLYFDRIYDKVDANTSQIQTLEKLRDTLLPKLISGELRVKL
jgi:type I restriction enzyme S subunit